MLYLLPSLLFAAILGFVRAAAPRSCRISRVGLPNPSDLPIISTLPDPFTFRLSNRRVESRADWECRREELTLLVQQYLYGFYPNRDQEKVFAHRDGDNLIISVFMQAKILRPIHARTPGILTAWAWAHHRILDAIEQVAPEIDTSRVGVIGCSRLGKAALAAGIFDKRIKLTLPLSSGAEGIGPWRYYYESQGAAEKINNIFGGFPYWSNSVLGQFVNITGNSTRIPFDAHELVSLIAPRAILWDEGQEDWWTNPEGSISVTYGGARVVFDSLGAGLNIGVHVRHPPDDGHCGDTVYSAIQPFVHKVFFGTPTTVNFSDISPFPSHPKAYPWAVDTPKF
ncbi:hypothetical protein C8Q79DRAFT_1116388 [Trametes meyenii]|nr:hypothetical protein C8Q79DRAFT_1116388 [Trametes meyenii]